MRECQRESRAVGLDREAGLVQKLAGASRVERIRRHVRVVRPAERTGDRADRDPPLLPASLINADLSSFDYLPGHEF